jgi:hypothetical protein
MKMKKINLLVVLLFTAFIANAQSIQTPAPSPFATFSQMVGLTEIKMEYSRPSVKGRNIFGTGDGYLLQYGDIWRTGANSGTQISFSTDVKVNGKEVPAGTYAIYTIPGGDEWKFILYKDLSVGGNTDDYKVEDEMASFVIKAMKPANIVETLTFGINNITPESTATLDLMWENAHISVLIDANADALIVKQIDEAMRNPMAGVGSLYASSANYYYNNNKDLNKALEWMTKACEINKSIFNLETKADIQAKLGKYKEAVATVNELYKAGETVTGGTLNFYNTTLKPRVDTKVAEWNKK